jgi:hypothetical protein
MISHRFSFVMVGSLVACAALLLAVAEAKDQPPPLFGEKTDYAVGRVPTSVAVADVDGDYRFDLVVTNRDDATVSVLLGNGDGTFGPGTDFGTGTWPYSIAVGDVDSDGHQDLAVANNITSSVSVLLGNGDGTFQARTDFATGSGPSSVVIADLNADGPLDLVVANFWANPYSVSILLGNGDGTFEPKSDCPTGITPSSVAVADLNGDGRPDLAVADRFYGSVDGAVSILLGNGDGTFGPRTDFPTGNNPTSVAIGDLNHDGRLDLATANYNAGTTSILLGEGDGTFRPHADFPTAMNPISVVVRDLDMDGHADLAVARQSANAVSVLLGYGNGTFAPKIDFATGSFPSAIAVADLRRDGGPDLAVTNWGSNTVSILLNTSPASAGVDTQASAGERLLLAPAYPNPATGEVVMQFKLPHESNATLRVVDATGRLVKTLVDGELRGGTHIVDWDGRGSDGTTMSPGIYWYELRACGERLALRSVRLH